jgi:hypothetical protein
LIDKIDRNSAALAGIAKLKEKPKQSNTKLGFNHEEKILNLESQCFIPSSLRY